MPLLINVGLNRKASKDLKELIAAPKPYRRAAHHRAPTCTAGVTAFFPYSPRTV